MHSKYQSKVHQRSKPIPRLGFSGSDDDWSREFQEICEDRGWKENLGWLAGVCGAWGEVAAFLQRSESMLTVSSFWC